MRGQTCVFWADLTPFSLQLLRQGLAAGGVLAVRLAELAALPAAGAEAPGGAPRCEYRVVGVAQGESVIK